MPPPNKKGKGSSYIFAHIAEGDESLHQLPADIALNAKPDSIIGAPY